MHSLGGGWGSVTERYWVESAPGYVRLRHELGVQGRLRSSALRTDGRWGEIMAAAQEEGLIGLQPWTTDDGDIGGFESEMNDEDEFVPPDDRCEEEDRYWNELGYYLSLDDDERERYDRTGTFEDAQRAAAERAGRGAGGISARSRAEMWRKVLSLPFDVLGERPLWITLTYPRDWRRWVPDGRALEAHRRAFGERWRRNFGEPVGFWTKEFQLAEGRPHLHLLMKGPESMPDVDYRTFQERTRLAKSNERTFGKYEGRAKTEAIGVNYGGGTAMSLRRWWAEIVTGNTDRVHQLRGVDVRTVFYSHIDSVALSKRRAAIAAYLAGETAKAKQKVPPDGFGTVGNYYGHWGRALGFRPEVTAFEVDREVWNQLNRRLTRLQAWQRAMRRTKGARISDDWKRRRSWQGLTVGGLGPEELARLLAWSTAAAEHRRVKDAESRSGAAR